MEKDSSDLNSSFKSVDQNDPFESALSSMVSSPTASNTNNNGENVVLRELIGRLGSICNNSSCYSTPLNSPPKLNLSNFLSLPTLAADPGFAERAARFSCFANSNQPISRGSVAVQENWESAMVQDSRENSTVSEQIFTPPNSRKRKSAAKGKAKEASANVPEKCSESSMKRSKSEEEKEKEKEKDYIHVRARRGQATDAHSLAERVRREKISERMKVLQDLVPGCNKVTGKAVMLDEIINYVQSLQRQVEFLSMKLATVNPRMEFNVEAALMSKDVMFQSRVSLPHNIYPSNGYSVVPNETPASRHQLDSFGDATSKICSFWEDDLQSIVQMGFGQQNFQGIIPTAQMKVEL